MVFGEIVTVDYPYCFTKMSAKKARQMQRLLETCTETYKHSPTPTHTQTQKYENNEKQ